MPKGLIGILKIPIHAAINVFYRRNSADDEIERLALHLLAVFRVDPDGDGTIVEEVDHHMRTKDTALNFSARFRLKLFAEFFVQPVCLIRWRRTQERRAISLSCAGEECELADDKQAAIIFLHRAIHCALFIRKDAESCDLARQPEDIRARILVFNAKKYE